MDASASAQHTDIFSIRAERIEDVSKIDYCGRVRRVNASLAMTIKC
jgi:hypothetical protein